MSKQNTSDPLTRHYQQQPIVGENKPNPSGRRNQEEALQADSTHIQLCHKTDPHMQSSRSKKKGKIEEHVAPRNGDGHEKNEQKLDRTGKELSRQSRLEIAVQRPMFQ
ncbi:unnamed protein product [Schistosoma margrebowiei]|uniref:Uncharacterized protein n=1 Tax=Schistosoma margrebowiei TaxID=48269 RepID=A0A183M8G1_9TREM|nr:unnamed protein product [Schistosoma margrebowiei]